MKNTAGRLARVLGVALLLAFGLAGAASAGDAVSSAAVQSEVAGINSAIASSGARWQAGETSMTGLSPAERMMRLGIIDPPLPANQRTSAPSLSQAPPLSLPSSLDWRNNGGNFVAGVRNQGNCGGCWAFGSTAALESRTLIGNNTPGTDLDLSEQVVLSCSGDGSCNGGYLVTDFLVNSGAPLETCYPYTQTNGNCSSACADWQSTAYRVANYTWVVPYGSQQTADTLKNALYTYGPVVVTFAVYADFYSYSSGIYSHTTGPLQGYHAVLLVGYDDVNSCFIVKNSWGTGWGEAGFFRIAYSELTGVSDFGYEALAYGDAIVHDTSPWTRQLGTSAGDGAYAVAVDTSGNVYAAGYTWGGLDGNTNADPSGITDDLFVVKYNSSGVKQWTRQLGTTTEDIACGVAVDISSNVYVTGYTYGGLDGNTSAGSTDLFVVKYDSSGVKQWTRQLGTSSYDYGFGVAVDTSGNVYVTGYTWGGLDGNTSAGSTDLFVVKYDSSGVMQWTRQLGTYTNDYARAVAVDTNNNVYVTGETDGGLDGNTSAGSSDLFVVKYDSSGVKQWTRQLGTTGTDYANGVAVDTSGNVYAAGYTQGGLDGNTNAGSYDLFVVKYNSSGVKQWTKQLGTATVDYGFGVAVDTSGNVYASGYTWGGLDGNTNAGSYDLFVVKYNSSGVKQWTKQTGTTALDAATGVAVDGNGNVYAAGYTGGDLAGTGNAGGYDLFVMKLAQPVASATLTASSSVVYTGNTVAFTASASGGTGSPEYLYWLYGPGTGNAWVQKAAYSSSNNWSFTPSTSDVGVNYIMVFVRASGSSASYETYATCSLTVNASVAPKSVALTASSYLAYTGNTVAFTASASGGTGPYEYCYWLCGPGTSNTWVQKTSYSTSTTWSWTASSQDAGTNYICVWARNVGSSASFEAYTYNGIIVRAAVAPTAVTVLSSSSTVTVSVPMSFVATATGGTGPYEYSFWLYGPGTGGAWIQKTTYSTSRIWYWTPTSSDVGTNYICVWARNVGSSASFEAYSYSGIIVRAAVAPTAVTIKSSAVIVARGMPVFFKASASGGTGPYEYSYWVYGPGTGYTWVQKTSYSTNSAWTWTPSSSDAGVNTICVWVRNVGSSASFETFAYSWLTVK